MKIATWNVNGLRARQTQFVDWVAEAKPDVVCIQEIKAKLGDSVEPGDTIIVPERFF